MAYILHPSTWSLVKQHLKPGARVLDIGCGKGAFLFICLRAQPDCGVFGIDVTPTRIRCAELLVPEADLVEGDFSNHGYSPESFDIVLCSQVIEHMPDMPGFLSAAYRLARPSGIVVVNSVGRAKRRWYYVRNASGEIVLDESHLKEFDSLAEFNNLLLEAAKVSDDQQIEMRHSIAYPMKWSLVDLILGQLHRRVPSEFTFWLPLNPLVMQMRRLSPRVRIPGYYTVESVLEKRSRRTGE